MFKWIAGTITLFLCTTILSYTYFHRTSTPLPRVVSSILPPSPTPTPDPLRPVVVLVLGYAGANHDGGSLSDTIIAAHLNPRQKVISLISLPRDLWVSLPLGEASKSAKINHAYAIGNDNRQYPKKPPQYTGNLGGLNLAKTVDASIIGIPIDYAVAVNFDGFEKIVGLFNPLTIEVPYAFDDYWYPIRGKEKESCGWPETDIATLSATFKGEALEHLFPCRYEHLHFDQGKQVMDAETALKFVRSRHAANGGGDFGRGLRQQALIKSLKTELVKPKNITTLPALLSTIMKSVTSDLNLGVVQDFLRLPVNPGDYTIRTITLDKTGLVQEGISSDGQYILSPVSGNYDAIKLYLEHELSASTAAQSL